MTASTISECYAQRMREAVEELRDHAQQALRDERGLHHTREDARRAGVPAELCDRIEAHRREVFSLAAAFCIVADGLALHLGEDI